MPGPRRRASRSAAPLCPGRLNRSIYLDLSMFCVLPDKFLVVPEYRFTMLPGETPPPRPNHPIETDRLPELARLHNVRFLWYNKLKVLMDVINGLYSSTYCFSVKCCYRRARSTTSINILSLRT